MIEIHQIKLKKKKKKGKKKKWKILDKMIKYILIFNKFEDYPN
jgi:hypothetical protein